MWRRCLSMELRCRSLIILLVIGSPPVLGVENDCQPEKRTCISEFYPFGESNGDYDAPLTSDRDHSSPAIYLMENFCYDEIYRSVYVNENGVLSFGEPLGGNGVYPYQFPTYSIVIAPFWADIDITGTGNVYYRQTTDPELLARATSEIKRAFPVHKHFTLANLFIATWDAVGYFSEGTDKTNTFQCVLATDGVQAFAMFLYGDIQWATVEDSANDYDAYYFYYYYDYKSNVAGKTIAGISDGDGINQYTIPGSETTDLVNVTMTSNIGIPGTWMFQLNCSNVPEYAVTVITHPSVIVIKNNVEYPAGTIITLMCRVIPPPPSDSKFSWRCSTGCSFAKKVGQSINITQLEVSDSGELNCSVVIGGVEYTSELFHLQFINECQPEIYTCESEFYPFGYSHQDYTLEDYRDNDDYFDLSENVTFYGERESIIYISENGILQFDSMFGGYTPALFPVHNKYVAPFWANVDTSRIGHVFYRQTNDRDLLDRATSEITAAFPVHKDFGITNLFIVTWDAVGYYRGHNDKTNTFQCVVATTGFESFVMFLYAYGRIQWTTSDDDGGINGLGGVEAVAGIYAGDGVNHFTINGSQTPDIINIDETSNVGIPGVWMLQIGKRYLVDITSDQFDYWNNVIFEYHASSNLTLTCMVTPTPPSDSEFSWSCSTGCFVDMETEQSINIIDLKFTDSGVLNCSVVVDGFEYNSNAIELRVIAECQPEYTCKSEFYPFGYSENDDTLPKDSDVISTKLYFWEGFKFFEERIDHFYVSDNGIIHFDIDYALVNRRFFSINSDKFIAPYWIDIDITGNGQVFHRQSFDPELLARATSEISAAFPVHKNFNVTCLFIVTWDAVGYYSGHSDKTNTFQCVIASDGYESFVIFLYAYGRIQWTTGDLFGGVNGFGGAEAIAGISAGDGVNYFTIPGSQTPGIINIDQTTNVGRPGVWMFKVAERYSVAVNLDPPVNGSTSIFDYPLLSNITLTCMVTPTPPSNSEFTWSCSNGCLFGSEQSIKLTELKIKDSGEFNCSVIDDGVKATSKSIELRVIGFNVTVILDPPVEGYTHIYRYPAGSNVSLICKVIPTPPSDSDFSWSCSTGCFAEMEIEQSVNIAKLEIIDGGDISCSVIVDDIEFPSDPIVLRTIGECQPESYTCESEFYSFGDSQNDSVLLGSVSDLLQFSEDIIFYDNRITHVYVSKNGLISFNRASHSSYPTDLPINDTKLVAPYWAGVNIRGNGTIYYRQTTDPSLLARATSEIRAAFSEYQNVTMKSLLIATWYRVDYETYYFRQNTDKTNTFQCVLATDGYNSFVIFLYAYGEIQWTTNDGDRGDNGLGGNEALAGINAGDGVNSITINGSQTPHIINIDQTSNVGIPGVWMFQVGSRSPCQPEFFTCLSEFYPFGLSQNDEVFPERSSRVAGRIVLSEDFIFYNRRIRSVYVNENGVVSFNFVFWDSTPDPLPRYLSSFVAPYWANVDIRGNGTIYYRQTSHLDLLARATSEIRAAFPAYKYFSITNLLIATWNGVGYYSRHSDKTNTFQCVLATDGVESFVIFLYAYGRIEWTTGDSYGGRNGLGEREAVAGINVGDGRTSVTIPGSMTPDIIHIDQTSNVGIPGIWMFQVGEAIMCSQLVPSFEGVRISNCTSGTPGIGRLGDTCVTSYQNGAQVMELWECEANMSWVLTSVLRIKQKSSYFQLVNVSDPVSFTCVFSGNPVPSVNWLYHSSNDRVSITTDSNDTHITSTLSIDSVVIPEDTDVYVCTASTIQLIGNVSYNLVVVPLLLTTINSITALEGQSVSFDCIPTPNTTMIKWLHNGEPVMSSERVKMYPPNLHHTLSINDLYAEDRGIYTCYVEGSKMFVNRTISVTVSEALDTTDCDILVNRCTGKCRKQYKKVRRSCRKILNRRSDCLRSCTVAVKKLLEDKVGDAIWHCGNPKGILRKLRNAYNKKC